MYRVLGQVGPKPQGEIGYQGVGHGAGKDGPVHLAGGPLGQVLEHAHGLQRLPGIVANHPIGHHRPTVGPRPLVPQDEIAVPLHTPL